MRPAELAQEVAKLIAEGTRQERAAFIVALVADAVVPPKEPETTVVLIDTKEAVRLAGLPEGRKGLATLYRWAQGQPWAKRLGRRSLRIDKDQFKAWLERPRGGGA